MGDGTDLHIAVCTPPYSHQLFEEGVFPESYTAGAKFEYCLARDGQLSTLELLPQLLITVIICIALKIGILSLVVMSDFEPIVTLGDAVASFLEFPDSTTEGLGPMSVTGVQEHSFSDRMAFSLSLQGMHKKAWKGHPRYVYGAISQRRWVSTSML